MRITVISDSHRNTNAIRKILNAENGGDTVFFLGDVTADIEEVMHEYPNKTFNIVSGNCDFFPLIRQAALQMRAVTTFFTPTGTRFR